MTVADRRHSLLGSGWAVVVDAYAVFGWKLPLLLGLTVANAVLEGLTLAMLLPLFHFLGMDGQQGGSVLAMASALFQKVGLAPTASAIGSALGVLVAASLCVFLAQAYLSTLLQAKYVAIWQERAFGAVIAADWPFLRRLPSGDLVGALTTESARVGGAFYQANLIASSVIFLIVQIGIAFYIAPAVTGLLLALATLLFLATERMVRRATRIGGEMTRANSALFATLGEISGSIKTIKATSGESKAKNWISQHVETIRRLTFRNAFDVQIVRAIFEYASTAGVIVLLVLGPLLFRIEVAAVLIVIAIFVRLFPKVTALRQCLQSIGLVLPAFDALRQLVEGAQAACEPIGRAGSVSVDHPARIEFRDVTLSGDRGEAILLNINLVIAPGEHIAFVGPTGAGKTTLLDCLLGLVRPDRGRVLVDDCDLAELDLVEWRRAIGYLGQDPVLLGGTLRENVVWTSVEASDREVEQALQAAEAGFALALPGHIEAALRERGGSLSGGERQRIGLARAFLGSRRLLVLDEATSALDVDTEQRVAAAIRKRRGQVTVIATTHRLASVRDFDRIVLIDGGRVVEQGSFADLIATPGRFATMWRTHGDAVAFADS